MSNIDKRALREAAEKASTDNHTQDEWFHYLGCSRPATVLALLDEMEAKDKQIVELQALARGVKQYSEFQICHYGATEDYAKGYIDCQNNYNKVLFAAAGKGE